MRAVAAKTKTLRIGTCNAAPADGRARGFTLLELIAVIFIISLLAAVAFPSFRGTGERKLRSDARNISSMLRYLNDSAVAAKETYSVKFDIGSGAVLWEGPEGKRTEKFKSIAALYLQSKGTVREGEVKVFAGPMGFQEHLKVHLRDGDNAMTVEFNPISGRTKITGDEK
ncbi:MAG: prepilin-type N-terminal cleavage/methylation domain-containing protein [Thermodesulfovibrionales bacterium]|nr:prepilin-type N-terminal cleavage/methylation domain-containing protein [Thermodesulfovibrionales bacterium]